MATAKQLDPADVINYFRTASLQELNIVYPLVESEVKAKRQRSDEAKARQASSTGTPKPKAQKKGKGKKKANGQGQGDSFIEGMQTGTAPTSEPPTHGSGVAGGGAPLGSPSGLTNFGS